MFIFCGFNLGYFFILELLLLILSFNVVSEKEFIDIKKLSLSDSYFVVLDSGLYLYNFNSLNCSIIERFNSSVYKLNNNNNRVILNELNYNDQHYILCIVNKYLFIFNEKNNKTCSFLLDIIDNSYYHYYDLLPYRFDNNKISFIIVCVKENSKLIFYFYNFSLNEKIDNPKEINFNEINFANKLVSCQINSYLSFIKCFYYDKIDNQNYFCSAIFSIENNDIFLKEIYNMSIVNKINQIKLQMSYNNKFFICFTMEYSHNPPRNGFDLQNIPHCYINDYSSNNFNEIGCDFENGKVSYVSDYKVFYFNETGDFLLLSRKSLEETIFNNLNNSLIKCKDRLFSYQEDEYSIIYNNGFRLIKLENFTNSLKCTDISVSEDWKTISTSYIIDNKEKIYSPYNKGYTNKTKYEIFRDIEEILKNIKIGVNYEIEGKDFIILIKPTNSTFFDNRTKIEFEECEQRIRQANNISNSSILSFFQMEIDNKEKNSLSDQIKYFTFDDQKKILDLSICEDIYTKIHFTIKNNTKIDISSISDFKDKGIDIMDIKI